MREERFISFDLDGMNNEDIVVNSLLSLSLDYINDKANKNKDYFHKLSGSSVEKESFLAMLEVAERANIDKKRIDLISGHVFPDIIIKDTSYGVEIKSTQKDSWTSVGSSIVESTRNIDTDRIYMLFGKLGGEPEFRCKPYQQCLSNIAVTHSPRYLIDMQLSKEETIFSKLGKDYDDFRKLPEREKIDFVRKQYRKQAKESKKYEMPWWMGESTNVNLSFYNDLGALEKLNLQARACILFQSLYEKDTKNRYKPISLWLCNNYSLLCPNMRDDFSAGGKCTKINGKKLVKPYPHVVQEILLNLDRIKILLNDPDEDLWKGIEDYWDFDYDENNLYESWLNMLETTFKANSNLVFVPIRELVEREAKPY